MVNPPIHHAREEVTKMTTKHYQPATNPKVVSIRLCITIGIVYYFILRDSVDLIPFSYPKEK